MDAECGGPGAEMGAEGGRPGTGRVEGQALGMVRKVGRERQGSGNHPPYLVNN